MYFALHTRARIQKLKSELRNTSKGSSSIAEFLLKIKALVNSLVSIGSMITDEEHIEVILGGLSYDYDAFVTSTL